MKVIPRFSVEESWGNDGDVTIMFEDNLPYELQEDIARKLQFAVPSMDKDKRCTYALQQAIRGYFQKLVNDSRLKWNSAAKYWMWSRWG